MTSYERGVRAVSVIERVREQLEANTGKSFTLNEARRVWQEYVGDEPNEGRLTHEILKAQHPTINGN